MNLSQEKTQDIELIAATLRGNNSAFKPLVEKYWGLVYSIVQKYVKVPETVSDICQEVFLLAFSKLQQFKVDSNFSPWIAKIAVNKSLEYLRKEKRAPFVDFDPDLTTCERFDPKRVVAEREFFDECLEKLSTEMQIVFILRHGLDFSYEDIAHVLNLTVGTVKGALFRIRALLKKLLSENQHRSETAVACEGSECHEEQMSRS